MTASQIAAFRLQRHHLAHRHSSDLVEICRDVCGVQAQVMGAARLALWARASSVHPADIRSALWEKRILVKTAAMRQTLHLLPAVEYQIYIAALRQSRMRALMNIMARINVGQKEVEAMTAVLMKVLGDEPVPQRELAERVKPRISRRLQASMKLFWNNWPIFRPAIIEGLICYGPDRGRETTFVCAKSWLPKMAPTPEREAKEFLLRQYLRAYAPATLSDFSKWSGISMKEAKPIWDSIQEDLVEVSIEGVKAFVLSEDLRALEAAELSKPIVRLLPSFDPYMLAHADKDHLVHPRYYKRVYRNQGWLSPVILVNGRVVGTWSRSEKGRKSSVQTELFEKVDRGTLGLIKKESENLIRFAEPQDPMG
jgi:hypothetical protein